MALHWLGQGFGYDITAADVQTAARRAVEAGTRAGLGEDTCAALQTMAASDATEVFTRRALGRWLEHGL